MRWIKAHGRAAGLACLCLLAACVPSPQSPETVPLPQPAPTRAVVEAIPDMPFAQNPSTFVYDGNLIQGGWMRGQVPKGTVSASLGEIPLSLDPDGRFFAAFDRDAGPSTVLVATRGDGTKLESPLTIAPRAWNIERVNVARTPGGMTEAFWRIREPELARIGAAREKQTGASGWRQDFIWPAKGRISGRFGSQRIYRGEPGSYHSGLDIAPGAGVPFVAPADGVVVLAAPEEFSLEGKLLIIDHGQGLNSAFLHASRLVVREGQTVRQGQHLGDIGASGRATGPHLHWSIKWRDARLDPLLFLDEAD